MAKIYIRHRLYEGLQYGPNGEIQFGAKAGLAPGIALVDEDDPLAQALMEDPDVTVVTPDGPTQVFLCPFHTDKEFKTRNALLAHMKGKGHTAPEEAAE